MVELDRLTAESILSRDVFKEISRESDEVERMRLTLSLIDKAKELGVKGKFEALLKAYNRAQREADKRERHSIAPLESKTCFSGNYPQMSCNGWIATDEGIYQSSGDNRQIALACYHPILPVERLENLETGEEQLKIAFRRNGKWREITVPKPMISSASKIVSLSAHGVAVTSENAKNLVRYLSDVENYNEDGIPVQRSSSKLGWVKDMFLPYDKEIVFDGEARFKQIAEAIKESGNRETWYNYVIGLRKLRILGLNLMISASFASVLIKPLSGLTFFVDLWGESGNGKSIALMVAASVWASPDEGVYIKDYKGTEVGLEAVSDVLNSLPLILDDTSKKNRRIEDNFEGLVYDLCSGKGKTRSNKELGLSRESTWKNCILTSGESPLSSYVGQGGALNRILEVRTSGAIFENPAETVETIKNNYGFAGQEFVEVLRSIPISEVREIQQGFFNQLQGDSKTQKQALSLSMILTADKIATDHLFKDGLYLDMEEAKQIMTHKEDVSENERCYKYILDKINMNPARFSPENENIEKWGAIDGDMAYIIVAAFETICESGKFKKQSFLSWAKDRGLIIIDEKRGKTAKIKRINQKPCRCIWLKLNKGDDDFVTVEPEDLEKLPFN